MMIIKTVMRALIGALKKIDRWAEDEKTAMPEESKQTSESAEVQSVWAYLSLKDNTQANHLASTIGFEEWVEMSEIKRRIKELFNMEYKNDRSLYPYIKTLVDCGLFESTDIGGKRKWRKKPLLLKVGQKQAAAKQETAEERKAEKSN